MKITKDKIKICIFFIYLLFVYIFGADPIKVKYSEIILILFIGLECIDILINKKMKYNIINIIIFIFVFYCFLSNLWAIDATLSITISKTLFLLSIFLLISYNFFANLKDGENILLKTIMYAGILFSIYIILYYGIGEYFSKLIKGQRIGREINNVNSIGLQTAISFIIAFFYGLYNNKKGYFILSIIPLIVSLGTGSRKVIVAIIVAIILMLILNKEKKINIKEISKKTLIYIVIIGTFIYIMQLPIFSNVFERFHKMISSVTGEGTVDDSTETRLLFTKIGMEQFFETPFLGIGAGNSGHITLKATGWSTYLHNNFVELLATTGIIGFFLYYSVYIYIIIWGIKFLKTRNKYINIVLIIFLINLILDFGVVSYYTKNTYIYFLLGIIIIEKVRKEIKNEKSS